MSMQVNKMVYSFNQFESSFFESSDKKLHNFSSSMHNFTSYFYIYIISMCMFV